MFLLKSIKYLDTLTKLRASKGGLTLPEIRMGEGMSQVGGKRRKEVKDAHKN